MTEYITKKQAVDLLNYYSDEACASIVEDMERLTAANVAPVAHAKWIDYTEVPGAGYYECSRCGVAWMFLDGTPKDNNAHYCPRCGARMGGEDDD